MDCKMINKIIHGDALKVLRQIASNSIDTIITDPPYGLKFMGKKWDYDVPSKEVFGELLRVAKPGAMLMCFGGSRTFHRVAVNIEDAGWEIRDTIMWLYGSGFPKSHDISKAIDKRAGAERKVIGERKAPDIRSNNLMRAAVGKGSRTMTYQYTTPATAQAKQWNGWGTALKPAHEPIILAMKTLDGTFAENALRWGVGGLWIDGGRVGHARRINKYAANGSVVGLGLEPSMSSEGETKVMGRYPANLILNEEAANEYWAKYFYCAKASRKERNAGLEGMEMTDAGVETLGDGGRANTSKAQNIHPTVKPIALMEYLCKLTRTPEGGIVLDPFIGSGTTALAARNVGRSYIGIELNAQYVEIAKRRLQQTVASLQANSTEDERQAA